MGDGGNEHGVRPVALPLSVVVGRNAKQLRGSASGDRLAAAARRNGLNWGTGRVADLEAGKVSPTLPMLIALALSLREVRGAPIVLADLLHSDEPISLNDALTVDSATLAAYLAGPIRGPLGGARENVASVLRRIMDASSEAEQRAAKAVGINIARLHSLALKLWGRPFEDERDDRAGRDASAQKRGRVTRQLYNELRAAVVDGDG